MMLLPPYGLSEGEFDFLRGLNTPEKIQYYLDGLPYNHCTGGYVCKSPRRVITEKNAHCLEGALFAAAAQRVNGRPPLIIEVNGETDDGDDYHFVAPFQHKGMWGAMAQSSFYTLVWRDPIHRDIRELVISYLYGDIKNGRPQTTSYTEPVDISCFDDMEWMSTDRCLADLGDKFDTLPHFDLLSGVTLRDVPPELEGLLKKDKHPHLPAEGH
jgi:hypothetical protein